MSSRITTQGTDNINSLKLKIRLIGTSDLIINSWYLTQTIQSIYETVNWIGWKFNYNFLTVYLSLLSSLSTLRPPTNTINNTIYNFPIPSQFQPTPANVTVITEEWEEDQENFNSTQTSASIYLTIHDKHKLMWLLMDSIFTILTIIILIAALCLILSSVIGQSSTSSIKTHLIRFWIFCNIFVAIILLSTFLIRIYFTLTYLLAPIYLITIFTYLCIRYKWVRIARKYVHHHQNQQESQDHHHPENYNAFTLQVPVPSQYQQHQPNLHLTSGATSSSSSFL